jgi:hypothetical protein
MPETANTLWYADHRNLHLVATFMGQEEGADIAEILDMLDKPWHYDDEFARAYQDLLIRTGLADTRTV